VDLVAKAKAEVVNRHHFFVEWFTGLCVRICNGDAGVGTGLRSGHDRMIEPDGGMIDVLMRSSSMVEGARGKRSSRISRSEWM
jgi:hypothetical protein